MFSRSAMQLAGRSAIAGRCCRSASPLAGAVAVRTYATPTPDSKPPVALFGIDGTYASALVRSSPE